MPMRKFLSLSQRQFQQFGFSKCAARFAVCVPEWSRKFGKMGCSTSKLIPIRKLTGRDGDEFVEGVVCREDDVKDNEMKSFELEGEGKVLVVKQNGKLSALGSKCTHYGAPLETGALGDNRIRCPWHGACFNTTTGDIEDFPGLDSLPCYQVTVEDGNVKVRAKRSDLKTSKRLKAMCPLDARERQSVVVIGGGPAGATCVETLRQEGFTGKITMIAKENCLPYDRVKCTKVMNLEVGKVELRSDDFYKFNSIDVCKNVEAVHVDTDKNTVALSNGNTLEFSKLFVATGCKPLKAKMPGNNLKGVVTIRTYQDANHVHSLLSEDKDVVVLGLSFIAMEAASYCADKVNKVTVVGRDFVPFRSLLGPEIGRSVMKLFESKGVNFALNSGISACIGNNKGEVESVQLVNGSKLKADVVIMGVGSSFATDFLKNSGVSLKSNGSVEVNEFMQTNKHNIYAGGDIAYAPVFVNDNHKSTIGHFSLAHYHGKYAALNILGKTTPVQAVPFFWTMLFGKGIRFSGHGRYEEILYTGSVVDLKFAAYYLHGDKVIAVSSCGMDPIVSKYAELRAQGKNLYRQDLGEDLLGWTK